MDDDTHALSTLPFGEPIAQRVADLLGRGGRILWGWNAHWMRKKGDQLVYEQLKDSTRDIFASSDRQAFARWLSQQSPCSLHECIRPTCADSVEEISHGYLADALGCDLGINDPAPFGPDLAEALADALDRGVAVLYRHRDYCGMGLSRLSDGYAYGPVYDGDLFDETLFSTRAQFTAWLAHQSDETLSGREGPSPFDWDNQRITRKRLLEAIAADNASLHPR
jgi:hypothetical protein